MKRILLGLAVLCSVLFLTPMTARAETYLIGDSRTNGMKIAVGESEGVTIVAKDGAGYSWMMSTALPSVESKFVKGDSIVITMGGNDAMDFAQAKTYVKTINELADKYEDCNVYYVSVNPVQDGAGRSLSNEQIDKWNDYIKQNLTDKVIYLDSNKYVEFVYRDWLHYDNDTNKAVYDWIMKQIEFHGYRDLWAEYARIAAEKASDWLSDTASTIEEIKIESYSDVGIERSRHQIKGILPHPIEMLTGDLKELGIRQVAYNMYLSELINPNGGATVPYEFEGKTYQFSKEWIDSYDFLQNFFTQNNYETTMILLCDARRENPLIHPNARDYNTNLYSFSNTPEGLQTQKAIASFLGSRYGYVKNWIVGNEVDAWKPWNYVRHDSFEEYMSIYCDVFQTWYKGLSAADQDARVYVSATGNWTLKLAGQYPTRDFLIEFAKRNKDLNWGLAYHPYNMPLLDATAWNSDYTTMSVNTPAITMQNIDVLTTFMGTDEMKNPDGSRKSIILSEFGYSSQRSEEDQAASIVYAYQQALRNPHIDAFLYTREVDEVEETRDGLFSGLKTLYMQKKLSFDWYAAMGTEREEGIVKQANAHIGSEVIVYAQPIEGSVDETASQAIDYGRIVFFGDSRTIDMFADSDADLYGEKHDNITVFGGHGKGYGFLQQQLDGYGHANYDTLVSFMGANDRGNFKNYQTYYEGLLAQGKKLVLCTVGPTVDWRLNAFDAPSYPNDNMVYYNKQLKEWAAAHGVKVIDTYQYIKDNITVDADGIHYTPRPTTALWQYILQELNS